jgi:23S rRNA pseudouridine955/2504/2580 synthase
VPHHPSVHYLTITEKQDGQRIDNVCFTYLKGVPKSRIYQMIRKGELRVNKGRAKPITRVATGDIVRIPPVTTKATPIAYQKTDRWFDLIKDAILYEDKDCIVLNKPRGFSVHGGSGLATGIIEVLRKHRPDARYLELVHRLDRLTSGCLLIAKKRSFLVSLQASWSTQAVEKTYCFVTRHAWPFDSQTHTCNLPLAMRQKEKMAKAYVDDQEGRSARTIFRYVGPCQGGYLVEASLKTGRMHQIRAHALALKMPIKGDPLYFFARYPNKDEKMLLHAARLRLQHPVTQEMGLFEAPLPEYFPSIETS